MLESILLSETEALVKARVDSFLYTKDEYYLNKPYYKTKDSEPDYTVAKLAKEQVERLNLTKEFWNKIETEEDDEEWRVNTTSPEWEV